MLKSRIFSLFLLFAAVLLSGLVSDSLAAAGGLNSSEVMLVWGEKDGQGIYQIHFSRYIDNQWSQVKILSSGGGQNILPAVSSDGEGNIWVSWTQLDTINGKIRFCYRDEDGWHGPQPIETATVSDMAPSLTISRDGVPWLAFSGSDGEQDDIFAMHWTGKKWSQALRVNKSDDSPDILPEISIAADGNPIVHWRGYNGNQYVLYSSQWDGHSWSEEQEISDGDRILKQEKHSLEEKEKILQNLPVVLMDSSQAIFYRYGKSGGETIKLKKR